MKNQRVQSSCGAIDVIDSGSHGAPVLFLHGNSSCKEIFQHQLQAFGERYRCIAMDLPGHGQSDNAMDPEAAYTMAGYARIAHEVMVQLGLARYALVGWSLGGHIGIELLAGQSSLTGLVLCGTPPISADLREMAEAFLPTQHMNLAGKEQFTAEEVIAYADATADKPADFLRKAVARTDGRARRVMMAAAASGKSIDQRSLVESSSVPIAIINGEHEPFVNNAYVASLEIPSLWSGKVHLVPDTGHAPFWSSPAAFNQLLGEFLESLDH